MPRYRVQIEGRNFLIDKEGRAEKMGFITFRVVDAADPAAAELEAVRLVRETERLRAVVRNPPDDPPTLEINEMFEYATPEDAQEAETGFIWFPERSRRWWQFWRR